MTVHDVMMQLFDIQTLHFCLLQNFVKKKINENMTFWNKNMDLVYIVHNY